MMACQPTGKDATAQQEEQENLAPVPLPEKKQRPKSVTPQRPQPAQQAIEVPQGQVKWMDLEAALQAQTQDPKPIFIDLYTDWCGWCKVMDRKTFSQEQVAEYMNDNFYPVKFNAEKEGPVTVGGNDFKLISAGRKQVHSLAYALLDGNLGYPAYVVLNERHERKGFFKGYRDAADFLNEVKQLQ
jgi:thioredoxin-related protein